MDNLFAVIVPNASSCVSLSLIDCMLSRTPINRADAVSHRISTAHHTIYLVNYARAPKAPPGESKVDSAIVGFHRVDNKKTLLSLCGAGKDDVSGDNMPDDEVLLRAYQLLGAECFAKVKGNFQSILWDEGSQRLCAALDPFSGRSLFYLKLNDMFCVASDAKTLAQVANITPTVNKAAVSQWLSGRPDPNISMFNEISRLPLGSCLEYSIEHGVEVTQFWDINPAKSIIYTDEEEYKAHFFELLKTSVENRLRVNGSAEKPPVFCQMSGGMDSTSVTAMANALLRPDSSLYSSALAGRGDLHTLSHRYKNTTSCDERNNINDMVTTLGLSHQHYIDLDQFESCAFAQLYPTDYDSPGIVISPKYEQELALMDSVGADVLLTGNGGDETCWGHSASYRSRLYGGDFGVIGEVVSACKQLDEPVAKSLYRLFVPSGIQDLVKLARNVPVNKFECPVWLTDRAVSLVEQESLGVNNPFSATFDPARHARYQGVKCTSTYNAMRSYQKIASGYGVDVRHPFFDVDIVEFSFAVPEKLLIQGVYPKWLLRHTMQGYLPDSVCWDKHKVVFDHHFANLVRCNRLELRALLSHEGLQDLGLVDNAILLREFDAVVDNPNGYLNVDMLYAILTQLWFQTHCV
jgi:asparagine synthetase B (glutamine-hydrolysing)